MICEPIGQTVHLASTGNVVRGLTRIRQVRISVKPRSARMPAGLCHRRRDKAGFARNREYRFDGHTPPLSLGLNPESLATMLGLCPRSWALVG